MAAAFLALRHRTFRNRGNLNNHIGLPLSLLELGRDGEVPSMAVVELGMSAPGEIRTLVGIAEPDVRVWTNVGEAHLEHFPSVEAIADAKAEILEGADADAVLVANGGDARVMARAARFAGRTRDVRPRCARPTCRPPNIESRGIRGMAADVATAGRTGAARDAAASAAATSPTSSPASPSASTPACRSTRWRRARRRWRPPAHRGEVRALASGVTVIDDAYNANPLAVERALDVLGAEPPRGRRVAVLGEMLELGPDVGVAARPRRPRGGARRRRRARHGRRRRRRARSARGALDAGLAARRRPPRRDQRRGRGRSSPAWCGRAISCWSRARAASRLERVVDRLAEGAR